MLKRTLFFGLPLAGVGTPVVESLRGYVQRLAFAHNLKPRVLIEVLLERFPWEGEPVDLSEVMKQWEVHGRGEVGRKLRERLERATGVDLQSSRFGSFSRLVAGQHLAKLGRGRYCPVCVLEDGAHGQLLWETACVKACPVHKVKLRDAATCGAPSDQHLPAHRRPKVPYACSMCGSLGFACVTSEPEAADDADIWVATQIGKLLALPPQDCDYWTADRLQRGLYELVDDVYQGSVVRASLSAGLSRGSVCTWVAGKHKPSLAGLMQLCHNANADVVELFSGRLETVPEPGSTTDECADKLAADDEEAVALERRPPIDLLERGYTRRTCEDDLRTGLELAVLESPPPNLSQLAARLETGSRFLREKWPAEVAALLEVSARYRRTQEEVKFEETVATFERCAGELATRGRPVTPKYLQAASGLVVFRQNLSRTRAMSEVVSRYAQLPGMPVPAGASSGGASPSKGGTP